MLNLGQDTKVYLEGKVYLLSAFDVGMLERWSAKVLEWEGDPFEIAKAFLKDAAPDLQRELVEEAKSERKRLRAQAMDITSELTAKWQATMQGALFFARLWLQKHHPDVEDMTVIKVFAELGKDEMKMREAVNNAQGSIPPNSEAPGAAPPGQTSTPTGSGTTSTVG